LRRPTLGFNDCDVGAQFALRGDLHG
jgi:hypothetical protein